MDATSSLQEYAPVVEKVTNQYRRKRSIPEHEIDARAFDRDDYRQEFSVLALHASRSFQGRYGFCLPAERRFVYKSLWRHTVQLMRRQRIAERHPVTHGVLVPEEAMGTEGQYEAAEALRVLQQRLCAKEWAALVRVAEVGSWADAWDAKKDGSISTFRRLWYRARANAENILNEVSTKRLIASRGERQHGRYLERRRMAC